jgi:hypothetical protein
MVVFLDWWFMRQRWAGELAARSDPEPAALVRRPHPIMPKLVE